MKRTCSGALVLAMCAVGAIACRGDVVQPRILLEVNWRSLQKEERLKNGEIVGDDGEFHDVLKVEITDSSPVRESPHVVTVAELKPPKIRGSAYVVTGHVRYQDVTGIGYLEMWSHFPDGSAYFTRTLDSGGTMGGMEGSAGWQKFDLPFSLGNDPHSPRPNKLVLNVVLPGQGTVWLSDLTLSEIGAAVAPGTGPPWWNDATGGWVGGILGAFLGLAAGTAGLLSSKGLLRTVVFAGTIIGMVVGALMLSAGLAALFLHQPYGVCYPLLFLGAMYLAVSFLGRYMFGKQYDRVECRRMHALDTGA